MRYVHTNLIARDWQRLSRFYCDVFGCEIGSLRDLSGDWLERGSGVPGARVVGAHLKLPGYGDGGPTLEIFQYDQPIDAERPMPHRVGFGHIAFHVDDVQATRERVIAAGGMAVGSVESVDLPGTGTVTWT